MWALEEKTHSDINKYYSEVDMNAMDEDANADDDDYDSSMENLLDNGNQY